MTTDPNQTTDNRPTALRTHLCGVLRTADVGQTVTVCGWVARRREHGEHLAFVDLRDHTGIIQCVIDHATDVRSEWVIAVTGTVRQRPEGTVNPGIGTGEVEIGDCTVEVLNEAEPPPFSVDDRDESDEPVRLQAPLRRPPPAAYAAQPPPPGPGQRGLCASHGPPGLRRDRDPAALGPDPRGLPGVLRAVPPAPRLVLRAAPEPAAGQAAAHGGRVRPLLPDRPLPAGRGPPGRPPVRVHAARHGVLLRLPGRRHGLRLRGRPRCRRGGDGGEAAADRAHHVGRVPGPLRHRQARPALRHGARRPDRRRSSAPRSRPSRRRPSRGSWCPAAPASRGNGSTSSPSRPRNRARRAWPGSASSRAPSADARSGTAPHSTGHWRATCRSRRQRASWNGRRRNQATSSWSSRTTTPRPARCWARCAWRSGRPP